MDCPVCGEPMKCNRFGVCQCKKPSCDGKDYVYAPKDIFEVHSGPKKFVFVPKDIFEVH